MPEERALIGVKEMATFLRRSESYVSKQIPRWKKMGIVHRKLIGRPPNRSVRLITFPSLLLRDFIQSK